VRAVSEATELSKAPSHELVVVPAPAAGSERDPHAAVVPLVGTQGPGTPSAAGTGLTVPKVGHARPEPPPQVKPSAERPAEPGGRTTAPLVVRR
jgi:hypothetical protein